MLREALKKLTQEQLVSEIVRLYSAMEILERQIIQMSDSIESHKNRIEGLETENKILKQQNECLKNIPETAYIPESAESMMHKAVFSGKVIDDEREKIELLEKELKAENTALKQRIKDLEDICDGSCFFKSEDERDKLLAELQDQHQQDCIKINQLHVTIDTLVDKCSRLRKTVGMD